MNQPGPAPTKKVAAGGAAGAVTVLLVFIAGQFGLEVPPEAAAALTTLLAFAAGWLKREGEAP
jgi:protein-S-isoprenylcysteine O-methyltransferase Ste14